MKDAPSEAAVSLKAHARRLHVGLRRPHNWLQLIRYCVVGATGYLVNLGVYAIAYTELPYRLAFTIAFIVAATSNFVLNRMWTFRVDHGRPAPPVRALPDGQRRRAGDRPGRADRTGRGAGHGQGGRGRRSPSWSRRR